MGEQQNVPLPFADDGNSSFMCLSEDEIPQGIRGQSISDNNFVSSVMSEALQKSLHLLDDDTSNVNVESEQRQRSVSCDDRPLDGHGIVSNMNALLPPSHGLFSNFSGLNHQIPNRGEESENQERNSLAALGEYSQEINRTSRSRRQYSIGTTRGGLVDGSSRYRHMRSFRTTLKSSLSDDDLDLAVMKVPTAPRVFRCTTSEVPSPGLFRAKPSHSVISSWSTDKSSQESFAIDDSSSLLGELATGRKRRRQYLQRDLLTDSLVWFSSHVPICVIQDLLSKELSRTDLDAEIKTKSERFQWSRKRVGKTKRVKPSLQDNGSHDDNNPKPYDTSNSKGTKPIATDNETNPVSQEADTWGFIQSTLKVSDFADDKLRSGIKLYLPDSDEMECDFNEKDEREPTRLNNRKLKMSNSLVDHMNKIGEPKALRWSFSKEKKSDIFTESVKVRLDAKSCGSIQGAPKMPNTLDNDIDAEIERTSRSSESDYAMDDEDEIKLFNQLKPKESNLLDGDSGDDDSNQSMSSLSDDGVPVIKGEASYRNNMSMLAADIISSPSMPENVLPLPYTVKRDCALLFVDITGFTKLSTILDVESLSKVINAYFRMIVDEVVLYGGDILKFAGDAFFAEWRIKSDADNLDTQRLKREQTLLPCFQQAVNPPKREYQSLSACVFAASMCAASIVEKYSDFNVPHSRDLSISFGKEHQSDAMLNVHCGIGVGTLVGLHVGDNTKTKGNFSSENRREYLFLGDPINQVSRAADVATDGQVLASPEALHYLTDTCQVPQDMLLSTEPTLIASRQVKHVQPKTNGTLHSFMSMTSKTIEHSVPDSVVSCCKELSEPSLARLHRQLVLYVHPVVRGDDLAINASMHGGLARIRSSNASQNRHRAESELRAVYTMFVKAVMSPSLTGIDDTDNKLYASLQNIMQVTCRELDKHRGHLRQFIVDDKGVVLIATFGLRGSTFGNMVAKHALPATFALHTALKVELKVENRIGATFGKVFSGVVGGIRRHEFAVMGAGVNLAARLMYSPQNNGILVDEAVQAHAENKFAFKSLPPVEAKGYESPVIIFEPLHAVHNKKRGNFHSHIGRRRDVKDLTDISKKIMEDTLPCQTMMAFIIGESGIGKSALGNCVIDEMKEHAKDCGKQVIVARSSSTEAEQRIPLSSFRKMFLSAIKELCLHDGTLSMLDEPAGMNSTGLPSRVILSTSSRRDFMITKRRMSIGRPIARRAASMRMINRIDSSTSITSGKSQILGSVPYLQKLCDICGELKYPYEFVDIVGSQLLGLDGAIPQTHVEGHIPTIDEVVDFLTTTYIRMTDFSDLILLFLDDFQWIDSLTWKVIRVLCQQRRNIFLMGAMRSQETQSLRRMSSVGAWHDEMQSRIKEIPLGPLDSSEVREAISHILGYDESIIDDSLCSDIYQKTGGLPMYVIETLENIKRKKTVDIDNLTGFLRWTAESQSEQDRIGSNNVEMIELSFLERFDALDATVRRVLQTCAVLGVSFSLSDVIRVHPELKETVIEQSLNAAVDEMILIEDIDDKNEDDMSIWSTEESKADQSKSIWNAVDDRFFEFSHAMWRKSVLDTMLKEQKVHLHRLIAEAMETEQILIMESSDIGRLLTLFDHWKSSGNFSKAAPLALAVGLRLEEWDLSSQSLDVYRDALEMCYESADRADDEKETPRSGSELWLHASAPTTTLEFILRLHIRIAKCHARLGEQDQCAITFEDAYKIISTSSEATRVNRELLLPVISGLCAISVQYGHLDEESVSQQRDLVNKFLTEATKHDDTFHLCRALSVEALFHSRIGQFECALASTEKLSRVYIVTEHSAAIREDYGKDYAAQTFANSTEWLWLVGDKVAASDRADFVVTTLLPHFEPRELDSIMELTFPLLMVMNALGRSAEAEATLFNNVINPYHDYGGSTPLWLQFFNPCAYLIAVIKMESEQLFDTDTLSDIESWVLDSNNSVFATDLQQKGNRVVGEICLRLAKYKLGRREDARDLIDRGRLLLARVVLRYTDDKSDAFLTFQAREMYDSIEDEDDDEASEYNQNGNARIDTTRNTICSLSGPPVLKDGYIPESLSPNRPQLKDPTGCSCSLM